jgi:hypothetical protein
VEQPQAVPRTGESRFWTVVHLKSEPLKKGNGKPHAKDAKDAKGLFDIPGAAACFLEFTGAGLAYIERAMERVEKRLALLGARMFEAGYAD